MAAAFLELVPSEVAKLQIPLVSVSDKQFAELDGMIRSEVDLGTLLDYTDALILRDEIGLSDAEIKQIRTAQQKLMRRRLRVTPTHNSAPVVEG